MTKTIIILTAALSLTISVQMCALAGEDAAQDTHSSEIYNDNGDHIGTVEQLPGIPWSEIYDDNGNHVGTIEPD